MSDLVELVRIRLRFRPRDPAKTVRQPAPPIGAAVIVESEAALGFELPVELKHLYAQIGNGGFGPGYGLLGLLHGATDDLGETAVASYQSRKAAWADEGIRWPERLVPICNWGCAIYSCIDCSTREYKMTVFDPNPHEDSCADWSDVYFSEHCGFGEWIELWARGGDLWARLYGDNGLIAGILTARKNAR